MTSNTPLYKVWRGIKNRCYNSNITAYEDYGGRGIVMSDEWKNNFKQFYNDMFSTYSFGLTIERKNVNGNYCKENCIWIPKENQSKNRRNTVLIKTERGFLNISEAAKIAGVSWYCIYNRYKRNYPIEKLLLPARKY